MYTKGANPDWTDYNISDIFAQICSCIKFNNAGADIHNAKGQLSQK